MKRTAKQIAKDNPLKLFATALPYKLIQRVKIEAAEAGIPIQDLVRQFIEKGLDAK